MKRCPTCKEFMFRNHQCSPRWWVKYAVDDDSREEYQDNDPVVIFASCAMKAATQFVAKQDERSEYEVARQLEEAHVLVVEASLLLQDDLDSQDPEILALWQRFEVTGEYVPTYYADSPNLL